MKKRMASLLCMLLFLSGCATTHEQPISQPQITESQTATVAWMSDTQYYSKEYPAIFRSMTMWLAEQPPDAVMHTGDVVHNMEDATQWQTAVEALTVLQGDVPLLIAAGNHDVANEYLSYTAFSQYMGGLLTDFQYENGRGCYKQIMVGERAYLLLMIGYGVDDQAVEWLNRVVAAYPQATVVLGTHSYLNLDGSRTAEGERLFREVVTPNANVRLVLCGHHHGIAQCTDRLDDTGDGTPDRMVYQLLADYQGEPEGGGGYMRLLHLSEDGQVQVATYSPYYHKTNYFVNGDSFTLQL